MKILFTGGGTAGHIFPIIAIVRELRKIYRPEYFQFYYIGPKDEFAEVLLLREGIKVKTVLAGKIRRYLGVTSILQNIVDLFKIPIGVIQSFFYIFFLTPDLIFSKGGYGSIPGVISGWVLWVPIFLHESDILPGAANKFTSRFALEVFVSFPMEKTPFFPSEKMISVGNPIRRDILKGSEEKGEKTFNLTGEKPVILILGGSQGSQRINDLLLLILPEFLQDFEVIHQTGVNNFKSVKAESEVVTNKDLLKYYHPIPFLHEEELKNAYQACDLIVSRSGANAIFEIAALAKPSVLIPLPEAAQNHQVKNAYTFAEKGASLVIEEANLTPHFFLERVKNIFSQPEKIEKMSKAAADFARPHSAKIVAGYILDYLKD